MVCHVPNCFLMQLWVFSSHFSQHAELHCERHLCHFIFLIVFQKCFIFLCIFKQQWTAMSGNEMQRFIHLQHPQFHWFCNFHEPLLKFHQFLPMDEFLPMHPFWPIGKWLISFADKWAFCWCHSAFSKHLTSVSLATLLQHWCLIGISLVPHQCPAS